MSGVTEKEGQEALELLGTTTDKLADILRTGFRAMVVEGDEWRPLARHVAGLVALALKKNLDSRFEEEPG